MFIINDTVLHIQIAEGKSTELGNSHSGLEQEEKHVVVFVVNVIVVNNFKKLSDVLKQHLIITYSLKSAEYQKIVRTIRLIVQRCF